LFHDGITRRVYYREERYHSNPQWLRSDASHIARTW
jgi:hypothetical protein